MPFVSHPHNFLGDCGAAAGWLCVNPSAACAVCAAPLPRLRWRSYCAQRLPSPYLGRNLPAFLCLPKSQPLNDDCSVASSLLFQCIKKSFFNQDGDKIQLLANSNQIVFFTLELQYSLNTTAVEVSNSQSGWQVQRSSQPHGPPSMAVDF